jgi:hypothetical protein
VLLRRRRAAAASPRAWCALSSSSVGHLARPAVARRPPHAPGCARPGSFLARVACVTRHAARAVAPVPPTARARSGHRRCAAPPGAALARCARSGGRVSLRSPTRAPLAETSSPPRRKNKQRRPTPPENCHRAAPVKAAARRYAGAAPTLTGAKTPIIPGMGWAEARAKAKAHRAPRDGDRRHSCGVLK